jgi:hypothetical protein
LNYSLSDRKYPYQSPFCFGKQTMLQATRACPSWNLLWPLQKNLIFALSICCITHPGSWNAICSGSAFSVEFISTSLPARDRHPDFQPAKHDWIFCSIWRKTSLLVFLSGNGKPKYLIGKLWHCHPRMPPMTCMYWWVYTIKISSTLILWMECFFFLHSRTIQH